VAIKQRAMAVEDKEERHNAILDAAEALFLEHPDRMANVSEVAETAGVAKGTVYLYFPSKEEMLLALHERHVGMFFDELTALLDRSAALDFDEVFAVTRKHIVRGPSYLPLTSICFGLMDREIPLERALEFKVRVGQLLAAAGGRLERHFPGLAAGDGIALLCNSYGLMVGMWQLLNPNKRLGAALERPELRMFRVDYEREVESALRALWGGTLARNSAAASAKAASAKRKKK
jgi:AcrR family transcriptional regulator